MNKDREENLSDLRLLLATIKKIDAMFDEIIHNAKTSYHEASLTTKHSAVATRSAHNHTSQ